MSIYRVNQGASLQEQIRQLNQMIMELNGRIAKAEFNKKELDSVFTNQQVDDRQYLREVGLGNAGSTYSSWAHVWAEAGYSIWKFPVTTYTHSSNNEMYFNDQVLENRGSATSETATTFDKIFVYNGDSGSGYTDVTTEAGTEGGTQFSVMDSTTDYIYIGHATQFFGAKFEWETQGRNYTLKAEYWNGTAWADLDASALTLNDDTNDFSSDGRLSWDNPGDWATSTVNSVTSKYWIRISTTTTPTTTAEAYLIIPETSVVGLLALSSNEVITEQWAWCYYSNYVYVTIRNAGNSNYEGTYFITSASSSTNKENFFVYNNGNGYEISYKDSTYVA